MPSRFLISENIFVADRGGTIYLDLATPHAIGDFVPWSAVTVGGEEISQFRLNFFDAAILPRGSMSVFVGPISQTALAIYPFATVENVKPVDLVVLTLNPSPRLEIREVVFNWLHVVVTESRALTGVNTLFRWAGKTKQETHAVAAWSDGRLHRTAVDTTWPAVPPDAFTEMTP